jgi:hypothetical protein
VLAIEAIGGLLADIPRNIVNRVGRISMEKIEDIEIQWNEGKLIVSVKDKSLSRSEIRAELEKFHTLAAMPEQQSTVFRIEVTALNGSAARSLADDVERVRQIANLGVVEEWRQCKRDFEFAHGVDADTAARTIISVRDLGRASLTAKAIFASTVRTVFPVQNFSDDILVSLFDEYTSTRIAQARRHRQTLLLHELQEAILLPLIPAEFVASSSHYVKTPVGYIRDPRLKKAQEHDEKLKLLAYKVLLRRWRKHTFRMAIADMLYRGPIRCPICNGPLFRSSIGNRGFVCSHCRYEPYQTFFYGCDCGKPVMLVQQPSTDGLKTFSELLAEVRGRPVICESCRQKVKEEYIYGRIFSFPAPWPLESFSQKDIIAFRKRLGWRGAEFKIPGESPLTLMQKGVWDITNPANYEMTR